MTNALISHRHYPVACPVADVAVLMTVLHACRFCGQW